MNGGPLFRREPDGSTRVRLRIDPDLAYRLEQQAREEGAADMIDWLFEVLEAVADGKR